MKAVHLIRNTLLTGVCVGLLAGCSWLEDWPPKGSEMARKTTAPKPPQSKVVQADDSTWLAPSDSKQIMAAANEPKGLNLDKAAADRIASLEKSISEIRNDLKMMMPALTKLAEAQGDLQKVLKVEPASGNINSTVNNGNNNQPVPIANANNTNGNPNRPEPGTVAWYEKQERQKRREEKIQVQKQQQQAYQQQTSSYQPPVQQKQQAYQQPVMQQASYGSSGAAVTNVRFGEHSDKTRLVFDASNKVSFSYDVDNNERILVITLPGTGWQAAKDVRVGNSPLVSSYSIIPDNAGGHQVIMQLKSQVKVLWAQALPPGGPQGHRVVFDLAAL